MDVETERLERSLTRFPKDKVHIDSNEEENAGGTGIQSPISPGSLSASANEGRKLEETTPTYKAADLLGASPLRDDVSESNERISEDEDEKLTKSEACSEAETLPQGVKERHGDAVLAYEKEALSEKLNFHPVPETNSENDALRTEDVESVDKSVESADTRTSLEILSGLDDASNPTVHTALPVHETNGVSFVKGEDRSLLTDKTSEPAKSGSSELRTKVFNSSDEPTEDSVPEENGSNGETDEQLNVRASHEIQEGLKEMEGVADGCTESALKRNETCSAEHSANQESLLPTLEEIESVKEPEEVNHKTECHLLHEDDDDDVTSHDTGGEETKSDNSGADSEWLYVLGHDKLKKRVIRKGLENCRPVRGQIATVNCVGHLEDGTEIDKHESLTLTLGDGDFIHAFDLCVALMDKEETCEVVTDHRFAYGELGRVPDIPPNAIISYIIELVDYRDQPEYLTMSVADRVKLSDEKRERGNYLYSRNEFSRSIDLYTKALKALDEDFESHGESAEELQKLIDTRIKCHNNMAAAQMKVSAWDAASKSCDVVLKVQPDNVKALFRKGKCLANKGDVAAAIPLLKRALKLEPETKIIHQELSRLEKKNKAETKTEKALYQKMLGTDKDPPAKKTNESTSSKWLWYAVGGVAAILVSLGLTAYRYGHV